MFIGWAKEFFTPKIGEDEAILTFAYFSKGLVKNPPTSGFLTIFFLILLGTFVKKGFHVPGDISWDFHDSWLLGREVFFSHSFTFVEKDGDDANKKKLQLARFTKTLHPWKLTTHCCKKGAISKKGKDRKGLSFKHHFGRLSGCQSSIVATWAGSSVSSRPARCLYSFCAAPKVIFCVMMSQRLEWHDTYLLSSIAIVKLGSKHVPKKAATKKIQLLPSTVQFIYTLGSPNSCHDFAFETNPMVVAIHHPKISCLVFHRGQLTSLAVVNGRRAHACEREKKPASGEPDFFWSIKNRFFAQKKHLRTIWFSGVSC